MPREPKHTRHKEKRKGDSHRVALLLLRDVIVNVLVSPVKD